MRSPSSFCLFALLLIGFSSCNSGPSSEKNLDVDSTTRPEVHPEEAPEEMVDAPLSPAVDREPTADEIREFGLLKGIEDGPYPFFVVDIEFPERELILSFNVNVESIVQDQTALYSFLDKYVSFYYISEELNMLFEVHHNGRSIHDGVSEIDENLEQFTGTLSGAETPTAGDLPDVIGLTAVDGKVMEFKEYITEELVAMNGQEITAYYDVRYNNEITFLKATEE